MSVATDSEPAAAEASETVSLDPFGFAPTYISRIIGIGGHEPGSDPSYVFHTAYVSCGNGPVIFAVDLIAPEATKGTLTLRVHEFSGMPHTHATVPAIVQINLRDMVAANETIMLRLVAKPEMVYAVVGNVYDDTDARLEGLKVTVDQRGDGSPFAEKLAAARRTVFGAPSIHSVSHLVSRDTATLADPVSQMCTMAQMVEPVYAEWVNVLRMPAYTHRKQWEFVYILQALRRYGMLEPGARGLGFGVGTEPLTAVMANMGCTIVATDLPSGDERALAWSASQQHSDGRDALRRPDLCPEDTFNDLVSYREVDMTDIPGDLRGFDFVWSSCAFEHLGSIGAGLQFVEDAMRCLKPGGLAVHTTELNLTSNDATIDSGGTVLFRRRDIERLTLSLISRGHEVAQVKFDLGDQPLDDHVDVPPYTSNIHLKASLSQYVTTSFGMIVRRGLR